MHTRWRFLCECCLIILPLKSIAFRAAAFYFGFRFGQKANSQADGLQNKINAIEKEINFINGQMQGIDAIQLDQEQA